MIINAKVSRENPRSYALWSSGSEVGWLRAGVIGFCRFPDSLPVRNAAHIGAETLAEWYRVRWQRSTPVAWDGAVEPALQVALNGTIVGRLFRTQGRSGDGDVRGFELRMPTDIWIATSVGLAQRIYSALHHAAPAIQLPALPATALAIAEAHAS